MGIKLKGKTSVRRYAIQALCAVIHHGTRADDAITVSLPDIEKDADKRFLHHLVYGVLRHYFSLEADVSRFIRDKPEPVVVMALILGAYQLRHLDTPPHAAVSETVEAIRPLQPRAVPLVNAILRQLTRHAAPKKLKPHQRHELPRWVYCQWRDHWGMETLNDFSKLLQSPAPLTIAVLGDRAEWLCLAHAVGLDAVAGELCPQAVLLPTSTPVTGLPWYESGKIIVMDQAAQASVHLLCEAVENKTGYILDLCAAPGGKTALLAYLLPQATIIAVEYYARRLPLLLENLQRLLLSNIHVIQSDAQKLPFSDQSMDGVFLDAPCSASGLLRKHPDVRFLHDLPQVERLVLQQSNMLHESLRLLKTNAPVVYAVCSIHHQEHAAIKQHALNPEKELHLLPAEHHDGFYAARLRGID